MPATTEEAKQRKRQRQLKRLEERRQKNKDDGKKDLRVALSSEAHRNLNEYKMQHGLSSKENAVEQMLKRNKTTWRYGHLSILPPTSSSAHYLIVLNSLR